MALPKKKNLNPHQINVGEDRIIDINDINLDNTNYLPKAIMLEDLDIGFYNFINEDLDITIDGKKVPVIFMTKEKWADFYKTWKMNDEQGNPIMPFITITSIDSPTLGMNDTFISRIAQNKKFDFFRVPTMEDGILGFDMYKVPQPIPVQCNYEVRLYTHYKVDINLFNEIILQTFASMQYYIIVNGYYIPIQLLDSSIENTMESFNDHNYYCEIKSMRLDGFLLNKDSFEIVRSLRNVKTNFL